MTLRDRILNKNDIKTKPVFIEEWDETVIVKALNAKEREKFEESIIEIRGVGKGAYVVPRKNIMAILVAMTVIDEEGNLVFEPADIDILSNKSASAIAKIFSVAQVLAGLREGDLEELAGNFN